MFTKTYEVILKDKNNTRQNVSWFYRKFFEPMHKMIARTLKWADEKKMVIWSIKRID